MPHRHETLRTGQARRGRRLLGVVGGLGTLGAIALACESSPTGPIPPEFAGRWRAVAACSPPCTFSIRSVASPADSLSLLHAFGAQIYLDLNRNGNARLEFSMVRDTVVTGTARLDGTRLILTSGATADTLDTHLRGDLLELNFRQTVEIWDFNNDGEPDPARLRAVLERR